MADYSMPGQEHEGEEGRASKRVFFVIEIMIFIMVIAATMNVVQKATASMQICSVQEERTIIYDSKTRVLSGEIAKEIAESSISDVSMIGNSIESCGVAYIFKDRPGNKYVVCEDGTLYKYKQYCSNI